MKALKDWLDRLAVDHSLPNHITSFDMCVSLSLNVDVDRDELW